MLVFTQLADLTDFAYFSDEKMIIARTTIFPENED